MITAVQFTAECVMGQWRVVTRARWSNPDGSTAWADLSLVDVDVDPDQDPALVAGELCGVLQRVLMEV